jgi:hypothetical protein
LFSATAASRKEVCHACAHRARAGGVDALAVYEQILYAGGLFDTAGGTPVNHIAGWDGSTWRPLSGPWGTGTNGRVGALAVFAGGTGGLSLFAGGSFAAAGGATQNHLARWSCRLIFSDGFESGDTRYWSR